MEPSALIDKGAPHSGKCSDVLQVLRECLISAHRCPPCRSASAQPVAAADTTCGAKDVQIFGEARAAKRAGSTGGSNCRFGPCGE